MSTPHDIYLLLRAPFPPAVLKWKPQVVKNDKALAAPYIDARAVQERLNDVLGVTGWQDSYIHIPNGVVQCQLSIRIPGTSDWVTREDVGGESDQKDASDRCKSAVSDALKRAAVKFGVGAYLYRLPMTWVPYDPQKRVLLRTPALPEWAVPREPVVEKPSDPKDGLGLQAWLEERDEQGWRAGMFTRQELSRVVIAEARSVSKDLPESVSQWPAPAVKVAVGLARKLWKERKGLDSVNQLRSQVASELERVGCTWDDFRDRHGDVSRWTEEQWKKVLAEFQSLEPPEEE